MLVIGFVIVLVGLLAVFTGLVLVVVVSVLSSKVQRRTAFAIMGGGLVVAIIGMVLLVSTTEEAARPEAATTAGPPQESPASQTVAPSATNSIPPAIQEFFAEIRPSYGDVLAVDALPDWANGTRFRVQPEVGNDPLLFYLSHDGSLQTVYHETDSERVTVWSAD